MAYHIGTEYFIQTVDLAERRAKGASGFNIGPSALIVHFHAHSIENPLDHVSPGMIVELRAASLVLEKIKFGK
ncbi:hypothetical protein K3177_05565 [Qipengyuania sp. GH25]|uniref:RES domain-containing protein n=1 Tax=Qipengyuania pacifica TaxID=2860199 RepID=A0ABS7JEA0_9SPHN|nr:hypothetical protein [Qipengyuania aerophila]MBX7487973.1 hypothetical protein [Qipengyuania aerophila]